MNFAAPISIARIVLGVIAPQTATVSIAPPSVILSWNAVSNAAGYNVYAGFAHDVYDRVLPAATNGLEVPVMEYGFTYHFAVTYVDSNGVESEFSNDAAAAAGLALNLTFPQPGGTLQSSRDLFTWVLADGHRAVFTNGAWHVRLNPSLPQEFFRTINTH